MKLTAIACQTAKPKEKSYKMTDGRGLFLLVQSDGSKYWRYHYRYFGKQKTYSLGVYPEVSLQEAREKHRSAHKLVSEGVDPNLEKRTKKTQQKIDANNTFEFIDREWLNKRKEEVKSDTLRDITSRLEKELFPKIGKLPTQRLNIPELTNNIINWKDSLLKQGFKSEHPLFLQISNSFNQHNLLETNLTANEIKSNTTIRDIFRRAFESAGYEYIRPHNFRHTITRYAEKQTPEFLNAIRQSLGHSSIDTTFNSYGQLSDYEQRRRISTVIMEF